MNTTNIRIGDLYIDNDLRNCGLTPRTKKTQTGKPRIVKIIALPTLSSPGVMEVVKAPRQPESIGKLRRFTKSKLESFYTKAVV